MIFRCVGHDLVFLKRLDLILNNTRYRHELHLYNEILKRKLKCWLSSVINNFEPREHACNVQFFVSFNDICTQKFTSFYLLFEIGISLFSPQESRVFSLDSHLNRYNFVMMFSQI